MNEALGNGILLGACVVWATALSLFKLVGKRVGPLEINLVKNSVGLLFAFAWIALSGGWQDGGVPLAMGAMFLSGLLGMAAGDTIFLSAIQRIGVGPATVGILATPLFSLLFETLALGYRPQPVQLAGIAMVLAGVRLALRGTKPLVAGRKARIPVQEGARLVVVASVLFALGQVLARWSFDLDPDWGLATSTAVRVGGGVVGLFLFMGKSVASRVSDTLSPGPHLKPLLGGALLGTGIGMALYQAGSRLTRATMVGSLGATVPLFAIPAAYLIAGEKPRKGVLGGALVAVAGTALLFL